MTNPPPLIGMLRQFKHPTNLVGISALEAKKLSCDFIFFHPEDINFKNRTINAQVYEKGKWKWIISRFPDVIDNSLSQKKHRRLFHELEKQIPFTTRRIGNKDAIALWLLKNEAFSHMVIPFEKLRISKKVIEFLEKYDRVILKPVGRRNGKGIHLIIRHNDNFIIHDNREALVVSYETLLAKLNKIITKNMIIQPFIHSATKEGRPFDIRIHIRRNGKNEWKLVKLYPRIGRLGDVFSNISQNDYINNLHGFLQENFNVTQAATIATELNAIASLFPSKFQKSYSMPLDALGIDIGVDRHGKLWIFEINSFPDSTGFEKESQAIAMDYAKYLSKDKKTKNEILKTRTIADLNTNKTNSIGFLSNGNAKTLLKTACSFAAAANGFDFFYFTPKGIDYEKKLIKAYKIEGFNKKIVYIPYPNVIIDTLRGRDKKKYNKLYKELSQIPMTNQNVSKIGNKNDDFQKLNIIPELNKYLIPTSLMIDIDDVLEALTKYNNIVLKPVQSLGGDGVHLISCHSSNYQVTESNYTFIINQEELKAHLKILIPKGYVIQPYIHSRTNLNEPFDIRVHLMRNKDRQWSIAKSYVRIGSANGIVSNTSSGGYIENLNDFIIRQDVGLNPCEIQENIEFLALDFMNKASETVYDKSLSDVGLDFGWHNFNEWYLFEINTYSPVTTLHEQEVGKHLVEYASSFINKK